ncbi:MAG: FHA domain-containing protein, partial [Lachnospiraceae bacterium]|nr:FHA domain-containing protein [Lachnospiraceae bacterium]
IYYKVGSFQSLAKLYKNREMKLEDVRMILIGLTGAIAAIQEYMLDERHVVLLPEYIFLHTERGEVRLLFHPFYEEDIREGIREFADYLIGKIDHTEQQAVMMGYQFYRIVRGENFIIEDIVELYRKESKELIDKNQEILQEKDAEINEDISENKYMTIDRYSAKKEVTENIGYRKQKEATGNGEFHEKNRLGSKKQNIKGSDDKTETNLKKLLIFSVLALMSGVFLCFGIGHYRPDHMAKVILALIMLVSVLGVGKEIMHHIRNHKSHGSGENNYDEIFSDYEKKPDNGRDNWDKPEEIEMEYSEKAINAEKEQEEEPVIYGRTVLLSDSGKIAENILMEKRRGKEIVHQLDEFPYVIGKVKDSVNLVLNDVSVSRIHAKLTEENGQIYVQDCHSTNGTYVNGVLLEKEERIPIEADDEIRIGRITLLYQ